MSQLIESWVYGAAALLTLALIVFPPVHPVGGVVSGVGILISAVVWPIFASSVTKLVSLPTLGSDSTNTQGAQVAETPDTDPRGGEETVGDIHERYVAGEITDAELEAQIESHLEDDATDSDADSFLEALETLEHEQ